MPSTSRRRRLRTLPSLAGLVALGGCSAFRDDPPASLPELYASNRRETTHRMDLRVSADGERVHDTTVEVQARDTEHIDCGWPETAPSYTIEARIEGAPWRSYAVESSDTACLSPEIVARPNDVVFAEFASCPTGIVETCE